MKIYPLLLFFVTFSFAQNIVVKFDFKLNELYDLSATTKKFTLKQNENNSIFELDDENDSKQFNHFEAVGATKYHEKDSIKGHLINHNIVAFLYKEKNFKNFKEDFQIHNYLFRKEFVYLKDKISMFDWNIIEKSDTLIANYKCQKAETKFRGREYVAYFSSEIATQGGLYKFDGLPGFILKIKSKDGYLSIEPTQVTITKNSEKNIYNPFKGKEIILFENLKDKILKSEKEMYLKEKLESQDSGYKLTIDPSMGIEDIGLNTTRKYE